MPFWTSLIAASLSIEGRTTAPNSYAAMNCGSSVVASSKSAARFLMPSGRMSSSVNSPRYASTFRPTYCSERSQYQSATRPLKLRLMRRTVSGLTYNSSYDANGSCGGRRASSQRETKKAETSPATTMHASSASRARSRRADVSRVAAKSSIVVLENSITPSLTVGLPPASFFRRRRSFEVATLEDERRGREQYGDVDEAVENSAEEVGRGRRLAVR